MKYLFKYADEEITLEYFIGDLYTYPNDNRPIKLVGVNHWSFMFENSHWCTDTVFMDLFNVSKNRPVFNGVVQKRLMF